MVIYYIIFIILLLLALLEMTDLKMNKKVLNIIIIVTFIGISTFRWEIGTDWDSYYSNFLTANNLGFKSFVEQFSSIYEFGYVILTGLVGGFTNNYNLYLLIICAIVFYGIYSRIFSVSKLKYTSILALFAFSFGYMFAVPRQGIAISLIFYSIRYIEEKKKFKFLLMVFIATLFHSSALVFLPAYFIFYRKINFKKFVFILVLFVIFGSLIIEIFNYIIGLGLLPSTIQYKLNMYLTIDYVDAGSRSLYTDVLIKTITRGFVILLIGMILLKHRKKDEFLNGYINLYFTSTFLYIVSFYGSQVFGRMAIYYEEVQYLLFAQCFFYAKKDIKILIFLVFAIFLFTKLYARLNTGYMDEFVPFKTIFSLG